jgi:hypothetical protein
MADAAAPRRRRARIANGALEPPFQLASEARSAAVPLLIRSR